LLSEQLVAGILRARCSAILPPYAAQFDERPAQAAACVTCAIVAAISGE